MSKPFVSFIVMSYKAEKFIQEAIDGALAQTYDNLEIIFSDDASPDKTFEIIEENVKNYTGKHKDKISIYRNEKNLGIGAHLNKLWWEIAKGDWIVVSAGDDVSLPNRVEKLMEYASEDVAAIHHTSYMIDENSIDITLKKDMYQPLQNFLETRTIEEIIRNKIHLRGGTMCLNTKMLNLFEPFNKDVVNEDVVLAYRAKYFGKILHVEEKLMKYREHQKSISYNSKKIDYKSYLFAVARSAKWTIGIMNQVKQDNKVLNLSKMFLKEIDQTILSNKIYSFLYGDGLFEAKFLLIPFFYKALIKRIILKPYMALKNK